MKLLHQGNHQFRFFMPKTLDYPIHLHNALEVVFLTRGSATVLYGSSRIALTAGDVFVCFPNQIHGYENSHAVEGYVLIVPIAPYLTVLSGTLEQKRPVTPLLSKGQWEHTGLLQLLDMAYREQEQVSKTVMQGYLFVTVGKLLALLSLTEAPGASADVLQAVLRYLHDHYTQPITRKTIAKAVGCNESYLSHVFTDTFDLTLTDYIVSLRIGDALEMLTNTTQSVSQIALSLGFGSIRSFNRAFLARMHMSPSAYRNSTEKDKK